MSDWTAADIPDQHGRTAIVTGANSGLGAAATRALAASGAKAIMACRNPDRAAALAAGIDGITEVRRLDLSDLSSVRAFADSVDGEIEVLITTPASSLYPRAPRRTVSSSTSARTTLGRSH